MINQYKNEESFYFFHLLCANLIPKDNMYLCSFPIKKKTLMPGSVKMDPPLPCYILLHGISWIISEIVKGFSKIAVEDL